MRRPLFPRIGLADNFGNVLAGMFLSDEIASPQTGDEQFTTNGMNTLR